MLVFTLDIVFPKFFDRFRWAFHFILAIILIATCSYTRFPCWVTVFVFLSVSMYILVNNKTVDGI